MSVADEVLKLLKEITGKLDALQKEVTDLKEQFGKAAEEQDWI